MEKKVNIDLDLRKSSRFSLKGNSQQGSDVAISNINNEQAFANCFDFSASGMRIVVKNCEKSWLKLRESITISFMVPLSKDPLEVKGVVVRIEDGKFENSPSLFFGVEFENLDEKARSVLENFIEISKMSTQMESLLRVKSTWRDKLTDSGIWFGIFGLSIIALIAFFMGQSFTDLDKINARIPASASPRAKPDVTNSATETGKN